MVARAARERAAAPPRGLRAQVLGRYRSEGALQRAHLRARWSSFPLGSVLEAVPSAGTVVELGCGHGIVSLSLAESGPERSVTGVDIEPERIEAARRAAGHGRALGNVAFEVVAPDWTPAGPLDAFLVVDVLYLLPPERQRALLLAAAAALEPGGVLVVKELDDAPRWKARFAKLQEQAATRLFTPTAFGVLAMPPAAQVVSWMREAGLEASSRRVDRGRPWPDYLAIGTKPGSAVNR